MYRKRLILAGVLANILTGCSSPPKLTEPEGQWVDFDTSGAIVGTVATSSPACLNCWQEIQAPIPKESAVAKRISVTSTLLSSPSPAITTAPVVKIKEHTESKPDMKSFVSKDGEKIPLYKALREIIPAEWKVNLSPPVVEKFTHNVSWKGNDQWPYVLRKMLVSYGLKAEINDKKAEIVILYAQQANVPVKSVTPSANPLVTRLPETIVLNPPVVPVVTQGILPPVKKNVPLIKPAPVPVLKVWTLDKGTTLQKGFNSWVEKEICPTAKRKWTVRWDTDTDYPIDYPLSFRAKNFEEATDQLFLLYQQAQIPLYASGYTNQCLIIVHERK